jgi:putative tryptophan/tyrosine transport system substrate-binding protein
VLALAARHAVTAIYNARQFTATGGLMSYGASLADAYRRVGIYVGRILRGRGDGSYATTRLAPRRFASKL